MRRLRRAGVLALLWTGVALWWGQAPAVASTTTQAGMATAFRGDAGLWLTPELQAAVPDPTQPLCDFGVTAAWDQYGFDSRGYAVYWLNGWGAYASCQIQVASLDVQYQMAAPNEETSPPSYTRLPPLVDASCASCTGPVSVVRSAYNCNPCYFPDPSGQWYGSWYGLPQYTVRFDQPIADFMQDSSGGDFGRSEDCPGVAVDAYTYTCQFEFAFIMSPHQHVWDPGETCWGNPSNFNCNYAPWPKLNGAKAVGGGRAVLHGLVDPDGSTTAWQFEWGRSRTALTSVTPMAQLADAGQAPSGQWPPPASAYQSVAASLSGLTPGVRYYYRLVAANAGGRTTTPVAGSFIAA